MNISCVLRFRLLLLLLLAVGLGAVPAWGGQIPRLTKPPLAERWFGIYVDGERAGFYHQTISETTEGYRMEGDGSVRVKVMGFSREATSREVYQVAKNLVLRSFEIEQNINGQLTRLTGKAGDASLVVRSEAGGKSYLKQMRVKGDVFPGPALNLYPLMRGVGAGKTAKLNAFDPEEGVVKEIKIEVLGEERTPDGQAALKLRNNLYPFVANDIWVDSQGNTLLESVRDGLVVTRAEDSTALAAYVGSLAMARKDLIYDFSLVRATPSLQNQATLKGLAVEISGWNDLLPPLQGGDQSAEKGEQGRLLIRTGTAADRRMPPPPTEAELKRYLAPAEKIEVGAPEIVAQTGKLAKDKAGPAEVARALSAWTADHLKDSVDDGGGALASLSSRSGNCQTHARLYTALARAAAIPTRFVSGLVSLEGKGFLYHSWAESFLDGRWVAVDPTYNQLPADPTHLKLFEGHTQEELAPIVSVIGKISIRVLETRY